MQPGVKYKVTHPSSGEAIGHFLDNTYYQPYGSEKRLGHINNQGDLIYYSVNPGEGPNVRGKYWNGKLTRDDGLVFLVTPDTESTQRS